MKPEAIPLPAEVSSPTGAKEKPELVPLPDDLTPEKTATVSSPPLAAEKPQEDEKASNAAADVIKPATEVQQIVENEFHEAEDGGVSYSSTTVVSNSEL